MTASRMVLFSRTAGYRHASIPAAVEVLRGLLDEVDATEDSGAFSDENLAH